MKYLMNQIGISALCVLFATATCNNSSKNESGSEFNDAYINAGTAEQAYQEQNTIDPNLGDTAQKVVEKRDTVEIKTSMGTITVVLYNETPLHRDNFLKLVNSNFYDGILFHRVIKGFMIQTGDPLSKDADPNNDGTGGPGYRVPAEIKPGFKHVKGTLAAARDGNPEKASSGSQFYICHAAAPWLDGEYTIFGETIAGLDVVDKIGNVQTQPGDRPVENIKIISCKHLNAPKTAEKSKSKKGSK